MKHLLVLIPALAMLAACGSSGGSSTPAPLVQAQTPTCNLIVVNPTVNPNPPTASNPYILSVVVENTGATTSDQTTIQLLNNQNGTPVVVSTNTVAPIPPGGSGLEQFSGSGLSSGTYGFIFSVIPAANDANGFNKSVGITFTVPPSGNG